MALILLPLPLVRPVPGMAGWMGHVPLLSDIDVQYRFVILLMPIGMAAPLLMGRNCRRRPDSSPARAAPVTLVGTRSASSVVSPG